MHGFGYVWISQDIGYDVQFIKHFKQRIQDYYLLKRHMDINNAGRGQHYKYFELILLKPRAIFKFIFTIYLTQDR